MATESFVSSAAAVSSTTAKFTNAPEGTKVLTPRGFCIRLTSKGLTISKASTFGGTQQGLTFPLLLEDVRDLADAMVNACT
jgi:hypothetical protein